MVLSYLVTSVPVAPDIVPPLLTIVTDPWPVEFVIAKPDSPAFHRSILLTSSSASPFPPFPPADPLPF